MLENLGKVWENHGKENQGKKQENVGESVGEHTVGGDGKPGVCGVSGGERSEYRPDDASENRNTVDSTCCTGGIACPLTE